MYQTEGKIICQLFGFQLLYICLYYDKHDVISVFWFKMMGMYQNLGHISALKVCTCSTNTMTGHNV